MIQVKYKKYYFQKEKILKCEFYFLCFYFQRYGKDINPFEKSVEKQVSKGEYYARNGMTLEELTNEIKSRPKRKFIPTESGKMKVVQVIGKVRREKKKFFVI